jgi:hypothetical protein
VVTADGDLDFVQQGAQQLLAVLIGGRGCVPYLVQVVAEGQDRGVLGGGQGRGTVLLAAGQLVPGVGQCLQRGVPLGFQAAGDQPVFRVDRPVAAFGSGRGVAGLLDLAAVLVEDGVVASFQLLGCQQAGAQRGGLERGEERVGDRGVDGGAAGAQVPDAAAISDVAAGAVVAGGGLGRPVVVDGQFPAAVPAGGQALAQGAALPDRAGAWLVGLGADVAGQAGLAGLVCPSR